MHTHFISDLHLDESHPDIARLFLNYLEKAPTKADTLYILGDFFEVWIGDDDLTPFHQTILNALKAATDRKLKIFMMHGNRDFLLGKSFFKKTGCQFLKDETVIQLYGTLTLLMHGDTLCTEDKTYLRFRKFSRNPLLKRLFLWQSLKKRRRIALRLRKKSQDYVQTAPDVWMDVTQTAVEQVMQKHRVNQLIHGHTHKPDVHFFNIKEKPATRIVLGAWHTNGNVLIYDENNQYRLEILDL